MYTFFDLTLKHTVLRSHNTLQQPHSVNIEYDYVYDYEAVYTAFDQTTGLAQTFWLLEEKCSDTAVPVCLQLYLS